MSFEGCLLRRYVFLLIFNVFVRIHADHAKTDGQGVPTRAIVRHRAPSLRHRCAIVRHRAPSLRHRCASVPFDGDLTVLMLLHDME